MIEGDLLRVVLIDDGPEHASLVARDLERELAGVDVRQVADADGFSTALASGLFDVVVTESRLGWTDGLSVMRAVKAVRPDCPVIMFADEESDDVAISAIWTGLDDYVLKTPHQPWRLARAVRSAIASTRERATRQRIEEALRESEARARAILDAATDGIVMIDESGCIESITRPASASSTTSRESWSGGTCGC